MTNVQINSHKILEKKFNFVARRRSYSPGGFSDGKRRQTWNDSSGSQYSFFEHIKN